MKEHFLDADAMAVMAAIHTLTEALDAAAARIADWAHANHLLEQKLPGGWQIIGNEKRWTLLQKKQPVFAGDWVEGKARADNNTFSAWRNGMALEIAQLARDITNDAWLEQMDALDKGA